MKLFIFRLGYATLFLLFFSVNLKAQNFTDNATNYGGNWSNNSNNGTGFGAWSFNVGSNSGSFISNPANNGMGTTGIGTTAFGMFATGNQFFSAYRLINNGMQIGDILSFYWAINFDAGGGAKGFDLRAGANNIFNVNNGNSATISTSNGNANTNYGTSPMLVTLTRTSGTQYSFSMTSRSGDTTYTTTINSSATIDGFNFYIGNQNDGAGQKNMYINAFSIQKPITIANGNWSSPNTWLNNTVPPASAVVTIDHNVTLNTNVTINKITINATKTFTASDSSPRILTLSKSTAGDGQTLVNNGTWATGSGLSTVNFSGAPSSGDARHQIVGSVAFQNVLIEKTGGSSNTGASFGAGSSVSGTIEIGNGGFISSAPPLNFYGSNAILKFDQGSSANYVVNTNDFSWSTSQVPQNITISSGTVSLNANRTAPGNLLIDGGTLNLNGTTLTIQGNWTRTSGSLNAGTSTVSFTGSGNTLFSVATPSTLYNLTVNKGSSANFVAVEGNLSITNQLTLTSGLFQMGTNASLTLSGPYIAGTLSNFSSTNTNDLTFSNSGTGIATLPPIATVRNLNFSSARNYTLASAVAVAGNLSIQNNATLTAGSFTINRATAGGTFSLLVTSTLVLGGTNSFPANYASKTIASTSNVSYNGGNQSVAGLADGISYGNLSLLNIGTKSFGSNAIIAGNFIVTDAAVVPPSILTFNGASAQNIAGINFNNIEFAGNGSKTFTNNGQLNSTASININSGNGTIDFDGASNDVIFTFKSDNSSSAVLGNLGSYSLAGNVTVERFTKSRRAFRFLTSSVATATSINTNWQEGQANLSTASNLNNAAGFGTQITGAGGATNGFDTSSSNSPSMFGFNNDSNAWTTITNTNVNTLSAGTPYRLIVRGDRSINLALNSATPTVTTLRARGTLHQGDYTVSATLADAVDKYLFVGNPYQCPVDMESILAESTAVNVNFIYVWNSNASTRGAYETVDVTTNDPLKFVQPGQAFFVAATGTNPSLTFTELDKVYEEVDETIFRVNQNINTSSVIIKLHEATAFSLGQYQTDKVAIRFGSFNNIIDAFDAIKFSNPDEELATQIDANRYSYQSRALPVFGEIIPLNIKKYRHQNYVFEIQSEPVVGVHMFLEDQYLNTLTLIEPSIAFIHEFNVESDNQASMDENRFRIVFEEVILSNPNFDNKEMTIFPNPSHGTFSIRVPKHEKGTFVLYNMIGQKVYAQDSVGLEQISVSLPKTISTGTYILKTTLDSQSYEAQIMIE